MSQIQTPPAAARDEGVEGGARETPRPARPARRPLLRPMTRVLNPLTRSLAGRPHARFFAVVHHRGRRSGRAYATPVNARPTADGFVIGLTFGPGADWFRNLQAAGGGVIHWNGADYRVTDPEIVPWEVARPAFHPVERALVPLIGIEQFVRVRNAPPSAAAAHRA